MKNRKLKQFILLLSLLLSTAWCCANVINTTDGHSNIAIQCANVQSAPKTSSIQATIDGHVLSVVFLENLGNVSIELSTQAGASVDAACIHTPNGVNFYIPNTGSYVVTFTLENGDEYYGEFEVTD